MTYCTLPEAMTIAKSGRASYVEDDVTAINAEVHAAQAEGREMSDGAARAIAAGWYDGDDGHAFVSTGAVTDPHLVWRDLFGNGIYDVLWPEQKLQADMLGTYLTSAGTRGPVDRRPDLWVRLTVGCRR